VNPRVARAIAALYSKRWQARYGEEFTALLESMAPTPANVIDACLPALGWRAQRACVALIIAACTAVFAAGIVRFAHPQGFLAWRATHRVAITPTVCRPYSKISHSAFAGWHRCLD
jgi:hypothetical protein